MAMGENTAEKVRATRQEKIKWNTVKFLYNMMIFVHNKHKIYSIICMWGEVYFMSS